MYYTREEAYDIANVMWQQLGGQRFSLTTGTTPICYGESDGKVYLMMSVGKNANGINRFVVSYNAGRDLYEVRFISKVDGQASVVAKYDDVYCDMLATLFSRYTGMDVKSVA